MVSAGGGELQWRLRCGVELAGVTDERRRWFGETGQGVCERARGTRCGTSRDADARDRWGSGVLRCSGHGGGEVATARRFWAAWRRKGAPARGQEAVEEVGSDAWVPARSRRGLGGDPERRAARRHAGGA